jgi:hydroxyacylglutathione hydrolase
MNTAVLQTLALEDEFQYVISKAAKGKKLQVGGLSKALNLPTETIAAWFAGTLEPEHSQVPPLAALLDLDSDALSDSLQIAWHPQTPMPARAIGYIQYSQPESNGYIITSDTGNEICLIDPAGDPESLKERIVASGSALRYLFVTHRHNDHADAAAAILNAYPDAMLIMHETEACTRAELPPRARTLRDREHISFGNEQVEVLFTPGHTDGSTCFLFNGFVCVGDTMFAGSVGGNFGPTATYAEQLENIRTHLMSLPGETVILAGHGPISTVALELAHNPFLKC